MPANPRDTSREVFVALPKPVRLRRPPTPTPAANRQGVPAPSRSSAEPRDPEPREDE